MGNIGIDRRHPLLPTSNPPRHNPRLETFAFHYGGHNLVNSDIKLQEPPQGGTSSDSDQLHAVHHGVCLCLDTGVKGDLASAFSSSYLASINQSLVLTLIINNSVLGTITRRITTQPKGRPDFRPQHHPQ